MSGKTRLSLSLRIGQILFVARSSIRYRILFVIIVFCLVPLAILGITSYSISKKSIDNKVLEYSKQLIRQTGENIDIRLSVYKDSLMMVLSNRDILDKLAEIKRESNGKNYIENLSLTTKLAYFLSVSQDFKTISFISEKSYIKGIAPWDEKKNKNSSTFYYDTIKGNNNFLWIPTREGYYFESTKSYKENVFSLSKQVFNINDGSSLNMVAVIDIREEVLSSICSKNENGNLQMSSFIIDDNGTIISNTDKSFLYKKLSVYMPSEDALSILNKNANDGSFESKYKGRDVLVNYYKLKENNWRVVNIIDSKSIYNESKQVIGVILIISLVSVFFSIIASIFLSQTISKPLKGMVHTMREVVGGNLKVRIPNTGKKSTRDEIAILQESFNYMIEQIESLIAKVYEEQNNKRIAEIKSLEAQINPHFLYNTLDTIKWTALFQKANNAAEMANLLSRLLHISLGGGGEMLQVQQEIEHVQCYIGIQKYRFNFNFEVNYLIDEDTKKLKIPKLIIQPFVENSILHGFEQKYENGVINIKCFKDNDHLRFEIVDNGCGFDMCEYDFLREANVKEGNSFTSIGVANVNERIKLICGAEYGINISSQTDMGTKVEIILPIIDEEVEKC